MFFWLGDPEASDATEEDEVVRVGWGKRLLYFGGRWRWDRKGKSNGGQNQSVEMNSSESNSYLYKIWKLIRRYPYTAKLYGQTLQTSRLTSTCKRAVSLAWGVPERIVRKQKTKMQIMIKWLKNDVKKSLWIVEESWYRCWILKPREHRHQSCAQGSIERRAGVP